MAKPTTLELVRQIQSRAEAYGLSVRCPECNAGIGKWCRVDMTSDSSAIVRHEARVAAATK